MHDEEQTLFGDSPDDDVSRPPVANVKAALEALLFVSDEPVSATTLADIVGIPPVDVDTALAELSCDLREEERGIQLREVAGGWRLYSHPAYHELIEKYIL
ncbi:MAG: SMC-Scp complex subunit ScpB, partial [Coriobacteriales bacterium]